jgi:short-subunit dehydrogenase
MSHQPVVVVTGASSGIGKATAIEFARNKYRLSLSGRDEQSLLETMRECEKITKVRLFD